MASFIQYTARRRLVCSVPFCMLVCKNVCISALVNQYSVDVSMNQIGPYSYGSRDLNA